MKRQKLIENLESIITKLKNCENDDVVVWAYDPAYDECGGSWIVMDGNFEIDDKNHLNIL